jgi:hypothetical protein
MLSDSVVGAAKPDVTKRVRTAREVKVTMAECWKLTGQDAVK